MGLATGVPEGLFQFFHPHLFNSLYVLAMLGKQSLLAFLPFSSTTQSMIQNSLCFFSFLLHSRYSVGLVFYVLGIGSLSQLSCSIPNLSHKYSVKVHGKELVVGSRPPLSFFFPSEAPKPSKSLCQPTSGLTKLEK